MERRQAASQAGEGPGPCPSVSLHSPNAYGTRRQGMKAVGLNNLAYQLLRSWLQTIEDTIIFLYQFSKHQTLWIFQQIASCPLLRALFPGLGNYFSMDDELKIKGQGKKIQLEPPKKQQDGTAPSPSETENSSSPESIYSLFDTAGRLDTFRMRKLVYEKGTIPSERKVVWKYLFGVYPEKSTTEERRELDQQMCSQYHWMKYSWKQSFPWATTMKVNSDMELSLAIEKYNNNQRVSETEADVYIKQTLPFQYINERLFRKALRDIDADVPRTDRHRTFFQRDGLVKLLYLRNILITYVAFHQDIGYCQGMNDFASRFLETLDNETEAFWCFVGHMRRSAWSFTTMGVRRKTQICEELLKHVDPELYNHIEKVSKEKLLFCLRWLLLRFQRDLDHPDAVRVLEISALESEKLNFGAWIWLTRREGEETPTPFTSVDRDEITFEVLLCIAVLIQNRKQLLQYQDVNDFFLFAQRLQGRLQLSTLRGEDRP